MKLSTAIFTDRKVPRAMEATPRKIHYTVSTGAVGALKHAIDSNIAPTNSNSADSVAAFAEHPVSIDHDRSTLYLHHHAGKRNRYKVRSRKYVDSQLSFLEVKRKVNKNRTIKSRIRTPGLITRFIPETSDFVAAHSPLNAHILEPKLWNDFSRITLVSKHRQERLTLDLNLQFCNDRRTVALPGIAVAEVKQDGLNHNSEFIRQMRTMNIRPTGFSKYCIGVSMLYENVKHNNFKSKLRLVNKLMRGDDYVQRTH